MGFFMQILSNVCFNFWVFFQFKQVVVSTEWIVQIRTVESGSVLSVRKARFSFVLSVTRIYVVLVEGNIYTTCSQHTTVIPIYVIDSILWPIPSHIISTIRSDDLFKRRSLMVEIQSDIKKLNRKMPSHKHLSNMFTKAQKLKQLIDKVVNDNLLTKL